MGIAARRSAFCNSITSTRTRGGPSTPENLRLRCRAHNLGTLAVVSEDSALASAQPLIIGPNSVQARRGLQGTSNVKVRSSNEQYSPA